MVPVLCMMACPGLGSKTLNLIVDLFFSSLGVLRFFSSVHQFDTEVSYDVYLASMLT